MLELLGVLVGFVTVLFVLSLATTGLSQTTSALFRLRGRNLYRGLSGLVDSAQAIVKRKADEKEDGVKPESENKDDDQEPLAPRKIVEGIFRSGEVLDVGRNVLSFVPLWLRGPNRTWIDKTQLKDALAAMTDVPKPVRDEVERLFPQLEKVLKKRFAFFMRMSSLFWAFVIAFAFQVSAPDLLRELSTDPEARARVLELASTLEGEETKEKVPARALEKLIEAYPEEDQPQVAARLAQVSAEDVTDETLRAKLAEQPDGEDPIPAEKVQAVVARYLAITFELEKENLEETIGMLGSIDIRLWDDEEFYWDDGGLRWENLLGVLLTALLLSLGAPFWYQMLSQLSGLRDMLSPEKKKKKRGDGEDDDGSDT